MAFLAALQFLTIAPPLIRRMVTPMEIGRAVAFFPLVGLLLGGLLLGVSQLLQMAWFPFISGALLLLVWVLATGALHLDGFLDTCDGLLGGHTPEARLRIMRDERVGAFAVVGGTLLLLVKYATLWAVQDRVLEDRLAPLLLAPALGRWGMVLAIAFFPYARAEGLGRSMKDHAGRWQVVLATLMVLPACWLVGGERGLLAMALVAAGTWLAACFAMRRLPGLTGDIYGAMCEMMEVLVLLVFTARAPA